VPGDHHLTALTVGDTRIPLLGETDLGTLHPRTEVAQPAYLLLSDGPYLVGHDSPAMCDDHVHLLASLVALLLITDAVGRSS
jgi:hypothetical protein